MTGRRGKGGLARHRSFGLLQPFNLVVDLARGVSVCTIYSPPHETIPPPDPRRDVINAS